MATLAKTLVEREYAPRESSVRDLLKFAAHQDPARQRRIDALMLMFGLWKGRTDIPSDGLAYQEELRRQD
ncbi:hypothetical protein GTP23_01600 [Pseudoduganella sp. FT93W]|uniref:Uncharacterized protein n=1 Tax=Duganella fentianensis TaxID=2692177 RepID=A0A845HW59_9BURK|nr:hypothetical protein [Duganella fentianensis]MYN43761.1 hypothetical protein [Duganella fentianensis]